MGESVKENAPLIRQFFVQKGINCIDEKAFQRKLYVIRKQAHSSLHNKKLADWDDFYIVSLSTRTIIFKGMVLAPNLSKFYVDFQNKDFKNAFCAVRPPGHHAEKNKAMGFCIYNNVAVGANYLIDKYKLKKVAIIDFDVHHGNGTQDIFYDNEKVLYISTHQYPYYPGSGTNDEKGKHNNILNIPLPAGTTSEEYLNAYEFVLKKIKEFKPEFILLSAGFDAHKDDPLAQLQLESKDFYSITKRTLELSKQYCDGKVVSILEGGYDLLALQESTEMHVKALLEFN